MIKTEENPNFLNSFLEYSLAYQRKSTNSVDQYNADLNMFLKYMKYHFHLSNETDLSKININDFSISDLERITQDDIHTFISYLSLTRKCGPATCARKISTIRIFFKYLTITTNTIKNNPAQNLETPKLNKRLPKYLSLEDSEKLLSSSEKDVIGKGNKERAIYLNKACIDAINKYLSVRPTNAKKDSKNSDKALFLSGYRQRISKRTVENIVSKELQNAGLDTTKYSTHKLRHTAATLMYKYGQVDIRALQELLGHQSISTTEIYTHVDNEQVRNAVEANPLAKFKVKK